MDEDTTCPWCGDPIDADEELCCFCTWDREDDEQDESFGQ